jgi:hypothetical protein
MPSVVAIANLALTHLGTARITSLDDAANEARAIAAVWDQVRDAVLRDHPWNCALARDRLAADSKAPAFGWAFAYTLPADPWCLRVLGIHQWSGPWRVEGRKLLTDHEPPLPLSFIARVTDPELFDPALTAALAARLAHTIAPEITQSASREDTLWALYERLLRAARSLDGAESGRVDRLSTFVSARY